MWRARHVAVPYLIIHSKAQVMSFFEMGPTADCLTASHCMICDCSRCRHLPAPHTSFEHCSTGGAILLASMHQLSLDSCNTCSDLCTQETICSDKTHAGESAFCILHHHALQPPELQAFDISCYVSGHDTAGHGFKPQW